MKSCPLMVKNEGTVDRMIRVVVGVLAFLGARMTGGIVGNLLGVVAILALLTAAIGFCGLYAILGISTAGRKKEGK